MSTRDFRQLVPVSSSIAKLAIRGAWVNAFGGVRVQAGEHLSDDPSDVCFVGEVADVVDSGEPPESWSLFMAS